MYDDLILIYPKLTIRFLYLHPFARPFKYFAEMERSEFNLSAQIVTIIILFNNIDKLLIIRYHTRESQKLTQYVSQISCVKIERISQIVTSLEIKFSKNVRAFTVRRLIARSLNLRDRILAGENKY